MPGSHKVISQYYCKTEGKKERERKEGEREEGKRGVQLTGEVDCFRQLNSA